METNSQRSTFRRLLGYLKPYRGQFFFALIAMALFGATDGAVPFLIRSILDEIFGAHDVNMLQLLPIVLVVFAVIRGGCGFIQQFLTAKIGLAITRDIRSEINRKLLTLSSRFFATRTSGSIITTVTNDTLLVRFALMDSIAAGLRDTIRVVALLATALYLDPLLGAFAFIGFPLGILPVLKFGKKVRKLSKVGQDQFGGLTAVLQETILGQKVVQSFGMEKFEQSRFNRENDRLTDTFVRAARYGALSQPTNELIASVAIAGIIVYGGYSVISGVRSQGDFLAFIAALFLMYEPLKKIGRSNATFQTGVAAAERIFEILDEKPEIMDAPSARPLVVFPPFRIEYDNVSFRYGESEGTEVLQNISLVVPSGTTLALVGMSGGGKTTLVNLLPRFFDPTAGEIRINGQDIRNATLASLRSQISVVGQHTFLFNDTVRNNILYGRHDALEQDVVAAAKAANAHDFIVRLPEGYDTVIGEQGFSLSGGERQRLAIARALLKNAPILVLDEATASLDSESEKLVQSAIDRLVSGRTTIVIAHRLSTVRRADKIAVMVKGRIVETGTHMELLAEKGEYAKLYQMQFQHDEAESKKVQGWV